MGDPKYDGRVLHNDPVTDIEKEVARQELANEELLVAPLDASIRTAESHVQACQKDADAIQRMLDVALSKLAISKRSCERLKSTRCILEESMYHNRSYFHPQRNIPTEVLVQIFRAVVEETEKERSQQTRQGVKSTSNTMKVSYCISLVCRKWRSVAFSDPALWRYISADINSPKEIQYIKKAVDLAKNESIVVFATRTAYDCWPDATWEALRALPPRISQVEVTIEYQGYLGSINWPDECIVDKWINILLPEAQYAAVGLPGGNTQNVPKSIEYYNLHALLDSSDVAWMHAPTVAVHWSSDVSVTPESLASFFQSAPHLQCLHLNWSSWTDTPPASTTPFAAGNLQQLRLNVFSITEAYTLLQSIVQLPSLSSLWLDFPTDNAEPLPVAAWKTFMTFNRTASAAFSIQSLVISSLRPQSAGDNPVNAHFTQLLDILKEMPGVHSLILKDSDAEILFHAMLGDTRIPPILPALKNLTLKRCMIKGETLVRWVKQRIPSNDPMPSSTTTALAQVQIKNCSGVSNKEWIQVLEIVDSFKTLDIL
jgi:F-box-like